MKKLKLFIGFLALLSISTTFGQQDPQYTQYMYNQNVLNPAYAGSRGALSIGVLGRKQWVDIPGSPQTLTLSAHKPIGKSLGVGLSVIHDEIGPASEDNLYADISFTVQTSDNGNLAFGVKAGYTLLDVRLFTTQIPADDLNLPVNFSKPNFGAGIFYYDNRYYVGVAAPNLLDKRHIENEEGFLTTASEKAHYFFTTGYVFNLTDAIKIKPSTMIKIAEGQPTSIDLSANTLINDKLEFGLNYRVEDSVSALVGFYVSENFRIGYAYDYTLSNLSDFNSGSHEVMLLFDFNQKKKFKSPRFF